jgi:ornithine cyclodeaminase/alanine dehydrogenase-like protein (mu-crystallin family)
MALPTYEVGVLGWSDAIDTLRSALRAGLDPDSQPDRIISPLGSGQLLTMPATVGNRAGVKLVTIADQHEARTGQRINGLYVLFDAETLAPVATLDGAALTALRTAAVSALAVDLLAPASARRMLVFGTGSQAFGHIHAVRSVRAIERVGVVGRDPGRTAAFVQRLRAEGIDAAVADPTAVVEADLVVCCTTAREPLFDGRLLSEHTVVLACGSHEPDAREVDSETVRRCGVLVESVALACAQAGDVVLAIADGAITAADVVGLASLVRGQTAARPRLIKTVGMGWQDLVIAMAIEERQAARG